MTKSKKSTKNEETIEKFTLIELVENCTIKYSQIVMNLSQKGLLSQLEEERSLKHYGCPIEPSMTLEEFNKIVEA